ncbi:MAG: CPBP family glutamic-type intramembrane protease [Methanocellales archaeon]|nr:CPBP family glutamic-type intramembrane protease [Methanocellales archaeon]MDD5447374.1 CPBP family glutamic-type intramembrane protease [Methanocellales archaeon]
MSISVFIKRHPALSYYLLVFAISWGGILTLVGGPGNIPGTKEQAEKLFVPALLIMFAGPFISGILMNFFVDGKEGLRGLLLQLLQWQVKARWYAVAVLTGPLLVATVLFTLSLFNKAFLPGIVTTNDKIASLIFGLGWGLIGGGLLEETGWTGFAVPKLRQRYSILSTGLIVGILWGIWHFMIAFWASNYLVVVGSWIMFVAGFLAFYLLALPAYRVLLVWIFDRTGGNLPVIMLMHAFLSASTLILQPSATGAIALVWNLVLGIVLWLVVAIVAAKNPGQLSRQPISRVDSLKVEQNAYTYITRK